MRCLFALLLALTVQAAPVSIFDGKSLAGWEGDAAWWRVEDGEIRGGSLTTKVPKNFFLATEKSYQNFDLRLQLRLTGTGFVNSGVQIRSVRVPNSTEMSGYQVDYGKGWYGKIYDESRRNKVIAEPKDAAAVLAAVKEGECCGHVGQSFPGLAQRAVSRLTMASGDKSTSAGAFWNL